jgi:hypothetical protein
MAGTAYLIQPVVFAWANNILVRSGDDAARAVILYSMNGGYPSTNIIASFKLIIMSGASSTLYAFWGIALYPTTDAATVRVFHLTILIPFILSLLSVITNKTNGKDRDFKKVLSLWLLLPLPSQRGLASFGGKTRGRLA